MFVRLVYSQMSDYPQRVVGENSLSGSFRGLELLVTFKLVGFFFFLFPSLNFAGRREPYLVRSRVSPRDCIFNPSQLQIQLQNTEDE